MMASLSIPPSNVSFNEMEFSFPSNAKLHSINEHQTIFAYLIEADELIISTSYKIHIIRLNSQPKHKISNKLPAKPNTLKLITIHNSSKSIKTKNKIQYSLVIGYNNGTIHVMDINCNIFFTQNISNAPIKSISIHFDNCFYSYSPSLILNCQSHLLYITADTIYKTLSHSLRHTLNDLNSVTDTLWTPKKIILTDPPREIIDIISIPPIDLMKHGIKSSILDPEPPLNLYTSNQIYLLIVGYEPCLTYVQIEQSSKEFGVRQIKAGANKLVKSAFNLVSNSMSLNMFSFWGNSTATTTPTPTPHIESHTDHINAREAAQQSIRDSPGTRYHIQCVFSDENRRMEQIILSPLRRYAAIIDSYGRICVLDCQTLCIVRMFKGCRGAQCGWIQLDQSRVQTQYNDMNVSFTAKSGTSLQSKLTSFSLPWTVDNTLLLVIYIAPRGILEIYHLGIKHRLGALLFNANGILLYHLSLFQQAKYNYGDPAHIFLCDYDAKRRSSSSTFSLKTLKANTGSGRKVNGKFGGVHSVDDIDLDTFEEEDVTFDGVMYELKVSVNEDVIDHESGSRNGLLSPPNELSASKSMGSTVGSGRYCPITFIHPDRAYCNDNTDLVMINDFSLFNK